MIEPLESRIAPASLVTITDATGDQVTVEVKGNGSATVTLVGGLPFGDIEQIALTGTDLKSKLIVSVASNNPTTVGRIITLDPVQHLGTIDLFGSVTIGNGVADAIPDVRVSGKLGEMLIVEVAQNTIFSLGQELPYDVPGETKTPDTYNNRPNVTLINIQGPGVELNVIGDGVTPQGTGGGGLGKVTIGSWSFPGFIRTTQSITEITTFFGDFLATLEVDKGGLGMGTQANVGKMTINNGAWGSSGSEIEGDVKAFDSDGFLAGATLTAGSLGKLTIGGDFDGTITLTDPDSPAIPTFTVNSDFTGTIISAAPIKKLTVKGDFMGSLQAPLIGAIGAYAFLGTTDGFGIPTTFIKTTTGGLGTLSTKAGPIVDFTIETGLAFKGMKVNLGKLTADTVGIDNVHITAASIGNIAVSLKAASSAAGIELIGIRDSTFTTTATGSDKKTAGNIGNIAVSLGGAAGGASATGILGSVFDARVLADEFGPGSPASSINSLGKIGVKVSGSGGHSLGLSNVSFEGDTIAGAKISVARKSASDTARGVDGVSFTATRSIGALGFDGDASTALVSTLQVWAGAGVGSVSVKSKTAANGTLADSAILAGQSLTLAGATDKAQLAELKLATLAGVSVSGSIINTKVVGGASIGSVSAVGDVTGSLILAGAMLGGDFAIDGDESYHRAASIAAFTVKGAFLQTSVVAGINPGDGVFGNGDDTTAAAVNLLSNTSLIGSISLAGGTTGSATGTHLHAIEAAAIASLKIGGASITGFPIFLDEGGAGEDASDVIVRII